MNKSETDIGDSNAGRTCSSKPDGRIKESHGQLFLANSACAGRVFPGCSPQFEINEFSVTWLIVLPAVWTCGQASCTLSESRPLPLCVSEPPRQPCHATGRNMSTTPRRAKHLLTKNGFGTRRGAAGKGSCCWTRPPLTHRSWHDCRWPPGPAVQHHRRRGHARHILFWIFTQKQNTFNYIRMHKARHETKCI